MLPRLIGYLTWYIKGLKNNGAMIGAHWLVCSFAILYSAGALLGFSER